MKNLSKFYKNKKVFITGHTGFKGSWLTSVLLKFGAKITGFSLNDEKRKNYENFINYKKNKTIYRTVSSYKKLTNQIKKSKPHIIFHFFVLIFLVYTIFLFFFRSLIIVL